MSGLIPSFFFSGFWQPFCNNHFMILVVIRMKVLPEKHLTMEQPRKRRIYAHKMVNYMSLYLGDYEAIKRAAIDPYIVMRDPYVQYRNRLVER